MIKMSLVKDIVEKNVESGNTWDHMEQPFKVIIWNIKINETVGEKLVKL